MLAKDAPWWAGERGNLPHAEGDNRPAYQDYKPTGANANNWQQPNPTRFPSQQGGQPQAASSKAPDMSAYSQTAPSSGSQSPYARYGVPPIQGPSGGWTPPQGARQNDLSGQVPSNQIWGQAYNQASDQFGGNTQAQSWTMPGSFASQGYNPTTGQYGQPTSGPSWDGNMAYNAIDQRPGPIQASATGVDGSPMQWQDAMTQREAFVGNLSDRLNQYSGGQLTGQPTFDPGQILNQANDQLASGTFYNPFGQQNPDVQRAMGGASQFATGSEWQNPFGNNPQANNPRPSFGGQPPVINTSGQNSPQARSASSAALPHYVSPPSFNLNPSGVPAYANPPSPAPRYVTPGTAQPRPAPSQGTRYNPSAPQPSMPPVSPAKSESRSQPPAPSPQANAPLRGPLPMDLQEMVALNELRSSGQDTPANRAGVRQLFQAQRDAKANPSKYPPGGRTAPNPPVSAGAAPQPATGRGRYTRRAMPWRASR